MFFFAFDTGTVMFRVTFTVLGGQVGPGIPCVFANLDSCWAPAPLGYSAKLPPGPPTSTSL